MSLQKKNLVNSQGGTKTPSFTVCKLTTKASDVPTKAIRQLNMQANIALRRL